MKRIIYTCDICEKDINKGVRISIQITEEMKEQSFISVWWKRRDEANMSVCKDCLKDSYAFYDYTTYAELKDRGIKLLKTLNIIK